ncbi:MULTISPECIES: nuclear transport factor 2 family protein [Pseudomonas]|uniref:Nuclear transport factor 2 family protein n=1 Tax=Pseudomonas mosselii TaxID=78327 RepID=A0A7W2JVU7_9PSED|nr:MULTISPECIES: nuclear transport factor 2 family protein [Pseudomonas]KXG81954.1 DUF4440 domain-containing protein [Pseudomonas mosselii]MBA6066091.1 nuclear transport factor 2 family protein [Pseudomonas mosselii]MBS9760472.1 nuclear transport factor 2 family protein [Pseudomonas mosselii]MCH7418894.1 nuclear transport factor 2 family protein [Pseudomonas mosselii]MCL8300656.1 nuclear transport factor 2 family protein [Pseudomonas mosselii]
MPEHAIARAERSIHHVHELIQMIFTRSAAETQSVLGGLMAVFADDFSMVGTTGRLVGRQQVEQLFKGAAGTRPGLQITVGDVQVVWQAGVNVAVRYKETHRAQDVTRARWSLALLECSDRGVVWRCLHETAIQ